MRLWRPGNELRRFGRTRMTRAAIVVAALIPLLYGALYLWAFWNPTGHLDRLPVALVNQDAGATDDNGKAVRAGDDVSDTLLEENTVAWVRTTSVEAGQGLTQGRYYAILTIPADFSSAIASAGTRGAHPADLHVLYNDANGVTGRTIVASVMREVRTAVSDSVGETAVKQLFVGVDAIRGGLVKARNGAGSLADGLDTAGDGVRRLRAGAYELTGGLGTAATGSRTLATGAAGLADGGTRLAAGLDSAQTGAETLRTGSAQVADGLTGLADGLAGAADRAAALPAAGARLAAGADRVASGAGRLSASVRSSAGSLTAAQKQVRALLEAELPADSPALAAFDSYSGRVGGSVSAMSDAADDLASGAGQVATGADALARSTSSLPAGLTSAAEGASALSAGASKISTGAASLATGLGTARSVATTLAAGAGRLHEGQQDLTSGLVALDDGGRTLSGKLGDLQAGLARLSDGATTLHDKLAGAVSDVPALTDPQQEANAAMISSPVALDTAYEHEAAGVGEGMAPYFIGLALYVGALIMWMLLRPISRLKLAAPVPASRVVAMNATPALLLGAVQAGLLIATLRFGLGLHVNHPLAFAGFAVLVSAAFVTLLQALNIWFGTSVGRLLTIVLLMLQLTSAGGSYPVLTSDPFFQVLHAVMPMTQVVNGFREAITGDLSSLFVTAAVSLVALSVASSALSVWGAARSRTWTITRLHPDVAL